LSVLIRRKALGGTIVRRVNGERRFEDPGGERGLVLNYTLWELAARKMIGTIRIGIVHAEQERRKDPQFDLLFGVLNRVRTVADVAADGKGKVSCGGLGGGARDCAQTGLGAKG
jgi:hypothetical protein